MSYTSDDMYAAAEAEAAGCDDETILADLACSRAELGAWRAHWSWSTLVEQAEARNRERVRRHAVQAALSLVQQQEVRVVNAALKATKALDTPKEPPLDLARLTDAEGAALAALLRKARGQE